MRFFRDLLLTGVAAVVALVALEGGLRVGGLHFNARLYQPDRDRGFGLRPGSEGWSTGPGLLAEEVGEGDVYIRINSDGMRDAERPFARPAGTLRIAVVGSCEAEARQVPLEKTFEFLMQGNIERALGRRGKVDVLNFGVPGYTLSQEYVTLRDHAFQYDPQVVVLVLQLFNFLKNTRDLFPGNPHGTPFYVLENGKLVEDEISRNAPAPNPRNVRIYNLTANLMNMSSVAGLANAARVELGNQVNEWRRKLRPVSAASASPVRHDFEFLRYAPDRPEAQKSWALGNAFIEAMKAECDRRGVEFRIVTVDDNAATHPDPAVREAFRRQMGVATLDAAEHRLAQFCAARGIPLLLTGPAVAGYAESHHAFLHGNPELADNQGFWNGLGHKVVGDLISRDLLEHSAMVKSSGLLFDAETQRRGEKPPKSR